MAGIYLHIPFCKKKCHYCDFHFSTNLTRVQDMVDAICQEAVLRKTELDNQLVETIYFGGGTPSILSEKQLNQIFSCLKERYQISKQAEISFEANPDNLTTDYLQVLRSVGVNRLSVGIQSFDDDVLTSMNRSHDANQSLNCVQTAIDIGFNSISIDLIYGTPGKDLVYWQNQVKAALNLGVNHISAYCLTIEENTVYSKMERLGELKIPDDEDSLAQFQYLVDELRVNGFEQYEISNFARPEGISKHNSAYWLGKNYLGLGPSAHSYNGKQRSWNIRNNPQYLKSLEAKILPSEMEVLSPEDQFNDYILTRLRTKWGLEKSHLKKLLLLITHPQFDEQVLSHEMSGNIEILNEDIYLTNKGKFIADRIASDFFV